MLYSGHQDEPGYQIFVEYTWCVRRNLDWVALCQSAHLYVARVHSQQEQQPLTKEMYYASMVAKG